VIQNFWGNAIYSLVPTILLGIVFWVVMRAIIRSDRTERKVYADIEAEERAKLDAEEVSAAPKK
jgi:flagellar biosynthesis/type III secretory pathway M-ring protein FliF/YscJ